MRHLRETIFACTIAILTGVITSCSSDTEENEANMPKEEIYGKFRDQEVRIFTLTNSSGMKAKVTEYGAILTSLEVPDRDGNLADVTLGYDTLDGWLTNTSYFGATVGRYGNRIGHG